MKERKINSRIQNQRVDFTLQNIREPHCIRPPPLGEGTGGEPLKGRNKDVKGTGMSL